MWVLDTLLFIRANEGRVRKNIKSFAGPQTRFNAVPQGTEKCVGTWVLDALLFIRASEVRVRRNIIFVAPASCMPTSHEAPETAGP